MKTTYEKAKDFILSRSLQDNLKSIAEWDYLADTAFIDLFGNGDFNEDEQLIEFYMDLIRVFDGKDIIKANIKERLNGIKNNARYLIDIADSLLTNPENNFHEHSIGTHLVFLQMHHDYLTENNGKCLSAYKAEKNFEQKLRPLMKK